MSRKLGWLGLLSMGSMAAFVVPTVWGKPWSIDHFFTRVFIRYLRRRPMTLSALRILEKHGLDFHSRRLDDFSVAFAEREHRWAASELDVLESYDRSRLSEDQRLSADILGYMLRDVVSSHRFLFHNLPVNQAFGAHNELPDFLVNVHLIESARDGRDYVARVARLGTAVGQLADGVAARAARGNLPPRFVIDRVLHQVGAFLGDGPDDCILLAHFDGACERVASLLRDADELRARLRQDLEHGVYPAYRELAELLSELRPRCGEDDGVWRLADGDAYYDWCLRHHTTTELGADAIHAIGVREVGRIHTEMKALMASVGMAVSDPAAAMSRLAEDPRFLYPDDDGGRRAILGDYQAIIDEIEAALAPMFGLRPGASVKVERIPEFKEASAPGAYYQPASLDGNRPGIFFANLRSVTETPRFGMRTLAYHEAVPGHHFQIAVAQELTGLPFFRRLVPFTAYIEGWALYAEQLAAEHGFQDDPYDRLGYLSAQLFRAARLVVDTGIHRKRWTREEAIAYMGRTTGMPSTDAVAEVERYIVAPGQACAYMIGYLHIMELRRRARASLGDRFDIRAFHDLLLGNGAMPLAILEQEVMRAVERDSIAS